MLRNVFLLCALVACGGGDGSTSDEADLNNDPLAGARAPLHVVWYGDAPSFLVEARRGQQRVLFYIDSAFARSYVATASGSSPSTVTITLGGKTTTMHTEAGLKPNDGYNSIDGLQVIGAIGADILMRSTTILDPNAGTFEVRPLTTSEREVPWHTLNLRVTSDGYVFTDIDVDGQTSSLWVDTGSAHSLLFWPKQAGDVPITTEDTWGNGIHMFQGKDTFAWQDGFTRTAPTFHCPSSAWPDLVSEVAAMEPQAIGLLGLSTLGTKRIVFQGRRAHLLVE